MGAGGSLGFLEGGGFPKARSRAQLIINSQYLSAKGSTVFPVIPQTQGTSVPLWNSLPVLEEAGRNPLPNVPDNIPENPSHTSIPAVGFAVRPVLGT